MQSIRVTRAIVNETFPKMHRCCEPNYANKIPKKYFTISFTFPY